MINIHEVFAGPEIAPGSSSSSTRSGVQNICNVRETLTRKLCFTCSSCLANTMDIYDTYELAFHRRGLCVSGSVHVTNGGSGGMMSTVGLELPYPRVSRRNFSNG